MMLKLKQVILFLCFWTFSSGAQAAWKDELRLLVQNGGVLAVGEKGDILYSHQAEQAFVPASTLKVPTSLAALKILGKDFRFKTEFYQEGGRLYVKGYGDPFLVSEEFPKIAAALKAAGLKSVENIFLDASYFDPDIQIAGLVGSTNPYDAYNGALLANFNTINIFKLASGEVQSAEEQTPVTEITRRLAARAPVGKSRINVAVHREEAVLYVGYLLKAFLEREGITVAGNISQQRVPAGAKLLLRYESSKNLEEVLRPALEFSQNLVMNQLFLAMGAQELGAPATVAKGKQVYEKFLRESVGLKDVRVEEGSGICREDSISPLEMDKVLVRFFPHRELLPVKGGMWVKTGTLTGVSSLVGYFQSEKNGWVRFVIILNQPRNTRDKIAQLLKTYL